MTRIATIIAAALAFTATLPIVPAQAQRDRVFVASYGTDTDNTLCSFEQPCRTFQNAINNVAVDGEVTAIDSAGFQPMTITQSVTITSPNGVEAGIQAAPDGAAITINAPGATVTLRGLTLEGAGVAYYGIVFNSGASLTVIDCVAQNFFYAGPGTTTGIGILMQPTSGPISFVITNTIVSNNGFSGIYYAPQSGSATANGVIDHVVTTNNPFMGIAIDTTTAGGSTTVSISNSVASNNSGYGIYISNGSSPLAVSIDNTSISGNGNGIEAFFTSDVRLGRSVIAANLTYGVNNNTSPNAFYSYQDNGINGNGPSTAFDVHGTAMLSLALQ